MTDYSDLLILSGSVFILVSSLGLLRMADFFQRLQVTGLATSIGAAFVFLGASMKGANPWKLGFLLICFFVTAPLVAHLLARSAKRAGQQMSAKTTLDPRLKQR